MAALPVDLHCGIWYHCNLWAHLLPSEGSAQKHYQQRHQQAYSRHQIHGKQIQVSSGYDFPTKEGFFSRLAKTYTVPSSMSMTCADFGFAIDSLSSSLCLPHHAHSHRQDGINGGSQVTGHVLLHRRLFPHILRLGRRTPLHHDPSSVCQLRILRSPIQSHHQHRWQQRGAARRRLRLAHHAQRDRTDRHNRRRNESPFAHCGQEEEGTSQWPDRAQCFWVARLDHKAYRRHAWYRNRH